LAYIKLESEKFFLEIKCSRRTIKLIGKGRDVQKQLCFLKNKKKFSKIFKLVVLSVLDDRVPEKVSYIQHISFLRSSCVVYSGCSKRNPERGRERVQH